MRMNLDTLYIQHFVMLKAVSSLDSATCQFSHAPVLHHHECIYYALVSGTYLQYFGGRHSFALRKYSVTFLDQMVLDPPGPVSCPANIHFTAVFALRNGKFSNVGATHPHTP